MNTSDEKSEAVKLLKLAESRLDKKAND
jgi:hypothetical protein